MFPKKDSCLCSMQRKTHHHLSLKERQVYTILEGNHTTVVTFPCVVSSAGTSNLSCLGDTWSSSAPAFPLGLASHWQIWERKNLKRWKLISVHSFRGFNPWIAGPSDFKPCIDMVEERCWAYIAREITWKEQAHYTCFKGTSLQAISSN